LRIEDLIPEAYASFAQPIFAEFAKPKMVTKETMWRKRSGRPQTTPPDSFVSPMPSR
jgi:hypothetical protein